jgi:outer membrane protein TolC
MNPRFGVWERRQVEAVRDAGASRAEFLAALEGYVKRLRDRQRLVEEAFRQGQASRLDVHEAKYRVLEAEIWLNQQSAR